MSSDETSPRLSDGAHCAALLALLSASPQLDQLLPSLHLQRFSLPVLLPPASRLSIPEAVQQYERAITTAHERVLNVWEASTTLRRDRTMQELDAWLSTLPALWGKTLLNCTPTDILAFLERSWLHKHAGTVLPDGSKVASPSGVNLCLSSMSTGFGLLGRLGPWTPATPHGNPIQSAALQHYRKGYGLQIWRGGYLESSAVPMTQDKVSQLLNYLDQQAATSMSPIQQLLFQRDALMALLMWETCLRGVDCGKVSLNDFFHVDGSSAQLPLTGTMSVGTVLLLQPNGSKTVKGSRAGVISLAYTSTDQHSSLPRLMQYLSGRSAAGDPVKHFLFNPLTRDQKAYAATAMTSSSLGKRLQKHLQDAAMYEGESNHGYRRGRMQHCAAEGMEKDSISQMAQIKTAATRDLYLDKTRHEGRQAKAKKRSFDSMQDQS